MSTPITVTEPSTPLPPARPDHADPNVPPGGGSGTTSGRLPSHPIELDARLDEFPLDLLLGLINTSRRSGVLDIGGPRPTVLHFVEGQLAAGESRDDPTLREHLHSLGRHSTSPEAHGIIEDHLVTALAAALIPSDAPAQFRAGTPDPEVCRYTFRLSSILAASRDRVEAWRVIADVMPSTEVVPRLARDLPPTLDQVLIERRDWQILSAVNGTRTVADIVEMAGRTAFDTCSSLYRMIVLGVLDVL